MARRTTSKPAETDEVLAGVEAVGADAGVSETAMAEKDADTAPTMDAVMDPAPTPPEPPVPPAPPAPQAKPRIGGGWFALLLGGVIAAAAGFGLSRLVPDGWPITADTSAIDARLAAQDEALSALSAGLARVEAQPPATDPAIEARVAALEAALGNLPAMPDLGPVAARVTALEDRLAAIESLPAGQGGEASAAQAAAIAALRAEVAQLKGAGTAAAGDIDAKVAAAEAMLADVTTQAETLAAEVAAQSQAALAHAALAQISAALDSGAPFGAALAQLEGHTAPPELTAAAETGVPTLAILRSAFPEAARAALEASLNANLGESWSERVANFLRSQSGARSLAPREGTDPDAVLSRAEAALGQGDLDATLAELAGLPDEGRAAMAGWTAMAEQRVQVGAAVAALSAAVDGQ